MSQSINQPLLIIALLYLLLTGGYTLAIPLWEAPDEPAHFIYANHFAQHGQPQPRAAWLPGGWLRNVITGYEWYQTPPYYAISGQILRINRALNILPPFTDFPPIIATPSRVFAPTTPLITEPHLLRFFSALLGLATILITYFLAKQVLPHQTWLPELAAGFVAFIPQFNFLYAYINNDTLAIVAASFGLLCLTTVARTPFPSSRRGWLLAGIASAPALAIKMTTWFLLPLAVVLALLNLKQGQRSLRDSLLDLLTFGLCAGSGLLISWLIWPDLLERLLGSPHSPGIRSEFLTLSYIVGLIPLTHSSFWGHFGWMNLPLPPLILAILDAVGLVGLAGAGWNLATQAKSIEYQQRKALTLLLMAILFVFLFFLLFNLTTIQPQGRYFYPAISAIGLFVGLGWLHLAGRHRKTVTFAILGLMLMLNILGLLTVILPTYGLFTG